MYAQASNVITIIREDINYVYSHYTMMEGMHTGHSKSKTKNNNNNRINNNFKRTGTIATVL